MIDREDDIEVIFIPTDDCEDSDNAGNVSDESEALRFPVEFEDVFMKQGSKGGQENLPEGDFHEIGTQPSKSSVLFPTRQPHQEDAGYKSIPDQPLHGVSKVRVLRPRVTPFMLYPEGGTTKKRRRSS